MMFFMGSQWQIWDFAMKRGGEGRGGEGRKGGDANLLFC